MSKEDKSEDSAKELLEFLKQEKREKEKVRNKEELLESGLIEHALRGTGK